MSLVDLTYFILGFAFELFKRFNDGGTTSMFSATTKNPRIHTLFEEERAFGVPASV